MGNDRLSIESFCYRSDAIVSWKFWGSEGWERIYIKLWSQNRFEAIQFGEKCYYCFEEEHFFIKREFGKTCLEQRLSDVGNSAFSGARTRERIKKMIKEFDFEKRSW